MVDNFIPGIFDDLTGEPAESKAEVPKTPSSTSLVKSRKSDADLVPASLSLPAPARVSKSPPSPLPPRVPKMIAGGGLSKPSQSPGNTAEGQTARSNEHQVEIVAAARDQSQGGAWKTDELEAFTGWSGETGSRQAKGTATTFHRPVTRSQEDNEILRGLSIKDDEMAALTRQIERRMLRNAGKDATSVLASIAEEAREKEEKLKTWIAETSVLGSTKASPAVETMERQISGLTDQLTVLQKQFDELLASQLERTDAETTMVQEAYRIIIENHRAEADTARTPSEVHRMEEHVETLKARSTRLATMTERAPPNVVAVQQSERRKKRFGQL